MTGPFIIRAYLLPKHDLLPQSLLTDLAEKAPHFNNWANEVTNHPSVNNGIWDETKILDNIRRRLAG